jgi:hypothetical protein
VDIPGLHTDLELLELMSRLPKVGHPPGSECAHYLTEILRDLTKEEIGRLTTLARLQERIWRARADAAEAELAKRAE